MAKHVGRSSMHLRTLGLLAVLLAACLGLGPSAAAAVTVVTGETPNGAFYRIEAPDGWQPADGLVIFNHGINGNPPAPVTDLGPLKDLQLLEGYAVAASSYSQKWWALFQTATDSRELVAAFAAAFAPPEEILIYGYSMGGLVTAQAIELGDLGPVVGAMPMCGALAGSRNWDGGVDLRLIYDFVCAGIPEAAIPGGANGLPNPLDPDFDLDALLAAVNACTGIEELFGGSAEQQANLARIFALTGIHENGLLLDMLFVTGGLHDLVYDPEKLDGGMAMHNAGVVYGDPELDAGIERVISDPAARFRLFDNYTPTGEVGAVKIVSIHTDKDSVVVVENESEYASLVPPANLTTAIAIEDESSHCGFTLAEYIAAWEALRSWVAGAAQPSATDIQADCEALGDVFGACRFDPDFVIPDFDLRIPPRGPDVLVDSDGDGMPDWWELLHELDPFDPSDADLDPDEDGLTNREEFHAGSDPNVHDHVRLSEVAGLVVPGFAVDTTDPSGATTFFAVRNTTDADLDVEIAYHGETVGDEALRVDSMTLAAHETLPQNVRSDLSDLPDSGGFATGLVLINETAAGGARSKGAAAGHLVGDYFRLDPGNDFGAGDRLVRPGEDFCQRQEIRFVDFGSGSELTILLDQPQGAAGSSYSYTAYDEAGQMVTSDEVATASHLSVLDVGELVAGESFGTVLFDFTAAGGGWVSARYSAFGRFSLELEGACRD